MLDDPKIEEINFDARSCARSSDVKDYRTIPDRVSFVEAPTFACEHAAMNDVRIGLPSKQLLRISWQCPPAERDALLAAQQIAAPPSAAMLLAIKGIGPEFAAILGRKDFSDASTIDAKSLLMRAWRRHPGRADLSIANKACLKQAPRLRATLIQLAWLWLRHQPQSALALWFKERVVRNPGRLKKAAIVALARKLLVALWKYVAADVVIVGAIMKAA
jgi:transposase